MVRQRQLRAPQLAQAAKQAILETQPISHLFSSSSHAPASAWLIVLEPLPSAARRIPNTGTSGWTPTTQPSNSPVITTTCVGSQPEEDHAIPRGGASTA